MPSLNGATGWVNSDPLGSAELRGHVVLVNFWTLTCINWLRQEPYVRAWSQPCRDDGLLVVGVHTPAWRRRPTGTTCKRPRPTSAMGAASSSRQRTTRRSTNGGSYELPQDLGLNRWTLAGEWTIGREDVALERAGGSIAYRFHARDAHLVLSSGARDAILEPGAEAYLFTFG
jgi:thioredoxin family protein